MQDFEKANVFSIIPSICLVVLVKDGDCTCGSHTSLIYATSVAVVLLLITLLSLSAAHYRKLNAHAPPTTAGSIYEQMTRDRPAYPSSDPHLAQTDLPANGPVYVRPQKAQAPECHYAVPRKAAHQQGLSPALITQLD
ncbi:hypothetical protein NFI96_012545 [Prochilodus magdalenae]|nr:hypothetical protein NFI96_012545 [Prochilodus magdalenae]